MKNSRLEYFNGRLGLDNGVGEFTCHKCNGISPCLTDVNSFDCDLSDVVSLFLKKCSRQYYCFRRSKFWTI